MSLTIKSIEEAASWDKTTMWIPCKNLASKLLDESVVLPKASYFQVGDVLLVSLSHKDRLLYKKVWECEGTLGRFYDWEIEELVTMINRINFFKNLS